MASITAGPQGRVCTTSANLRQVAPRHACFQAATTQTKRTLVRSSAAAVAAPEPQLKSTVKVYKNTEFEEDIPYDPSLLSLPKGYHWYETMLILKASTSDEERDKELAKFEVFLAREGAMNVSSVAKKGKNNEVMLAYRMGKETKGFYVLYQYTASRKTAKAVQLYLSTPEAGSEGRILRHMTFCKY